MEKVIRDGKVAVLYSPGYGAGWSSWNRDHKNALMFHPKLVELVEKRDFETLSDEEKIKEILGLPEDHGMYCGGGSKLRIEWMPQGTRFLINEYDGSESIQFIDLEFEVA